MRTLIVVLVFFNASVFAADCNWFNNDLKIKKADCKSEVSKKAERLCKRGKYEAALKAIAHVAMKEEYETLAQARFEYSMLLSRLFLLNYPAKHCYSGAELERRKKVSHEYANSFDRFTWLGEYDYK